MASPNLCENLRILYRDPDLAVCVKPAGTDSENEMPALLAATMAVSRVWCVHRLDRQVGGVMVYALNGKTAASLGGQFSAGKVAKEYLAAAEGSFQPAEGELRDLLFHDGRTNKTFIVDRMRKGVKEAALKYHTIQTVEEIGQTLSLLSVELMTGRSHQIRIQFASRKHPLLGDTRYGSRMKGNGFGLWCRRLAFSHPGNGKMMEFFSIPPEVFPWTSFSFD